MISDLPIQHVTQAAARHPDKDALVCVPSGRRLTYADLEREANRGVHALRGLGLQPGDGIAFSLPNGEAFAIAMLAAARAGLYYTPLPTKASASDIAYICANAGAKLLLLDSASPVGSELAVRLAPDRTVMFSSDEPESPGPWQALLARQPVSLPENPQPGIEMVFSSGSTGRPKGVRKPITAPTWDAPDPRNVATAQANRLSAKSVYLSTSPLYHSAPHRYLSASLSVGATVVVLSHFDAELALECLNRYACTHSLWVPTMFHRMLKLEPNVRARYRGEHHHHAIHGAAPCPVPLKRAMIDWWGPILYEYYSGSEGLGSTAIDSHEWLAHPGSVGKPRQLAVHVLDDDHRPQPAGVVGNIYFEAPTSFAYWGDPEKTRAAISPQGWKTYGDIGYLDADGYLYLTDRRSFTVISGGVNVYPQEVENTLLSHPDVQDAAVFGVPDEDLGEKLAAVVQLAHGAAGDAAAAQALQAYCKAEGGAIKTPKLIRFCTEFPRTDSGKILKAGLRQQFMQDTGATTYA
ncbi:AMP-binding protein [Ottowia sp. GY511]|uniref:AMP-binding protein n=1 Tax=Ottowia flava TaxID=2675430 RepID=A0ABW4KRN8_9BURK|nr:AMP-binding protein [Ottowia sp. GY511]TXK23543.1 AMP-binding protein [Ottowia sp. GY511]